MVRRSTLKSKGKIFLVFLLVLTLLFSGWPQIWQNPKIPPKIPKAQAAVGDIGHWRDSVGGQIAGTTFGAFNFDSQIRNDGIYTHPSNSTIELSEAGSYLIIASLRSNDNSNGRTNIQSRVALTSGTGNLFTSNYTGYSRDSSEHENWTRAVGILINGSANAQVQIQVRRDTDAPTGGSVANASDVQVVRINPSNWGMYAIGGSGNAYGGTTPNTVDVSSATLESNTSAIEGNTTTDTVTVKGDNKRYLVAWSVSGNTGGSRTQRIGHLKYDGTDDLATSSYCYQRQSSDEYCGLGSMDIIETSSTDRTIQVEVYRGDGVAADQGGADVDGSWVTDGNGQMVVVELPDTMDVFRSHDSTGLQDVTSAVTLNAMRNVDFNDSASFGKASNSAMDVVNASDIFVWANVWTARNNVSAGTRLTAYGSITVNDVEQSTGRLGNYTRGNQGSQDTFGGSFHPAGIFTVDTDGYDVGVNMDPLSGTEGGGTDRTEAGTVGFFALKLGNLNFSPSAPTLHDVPFNNEKTGDSTPDFEFTGSDPDGTADIIYQIQIDNDYAFGSPLVNCESDTTCADGAGSFTNTVTGSDTNPFNEGERIRFTPTTAMTTGTTYYWRVRAKDDSGSGGSNNYGDWSSIPSVTFVSGTSSPEWFQTTNEQFDTGNLTNTFSTNDSVQLQGPVGEYGTATLTNNNTLTVNLNNNYNNLVVVASPRYAPNTDAQRVARIMAKTSTSFDIKVDNYAGSLTGSTTVDWVAMEAGSWTIADGGTGTKVIAGTQSTSIQAYNGSWPTGTQVNFSPNFDSAPVVIHNVASNNSSSWTASSVNDGTQQGEPTASSMRVLLNTSFDTASHGSAEDIDYIAFDAGHGTNNSVEFDAVSADTVSCCTTTGYATNFYSAFSTAPEVYTISQMGEDGGNGGYATTHTGTAVSATTHYGSIDEDGPSADRTHTSEQVAIISFGASSGDIVLQSPITSGTIMSPEIDFDWVSGQSSWGTAGFSTTETNGDVKLKVYYTDSSPCDTIIPDSALSGNSSGFDVSASPVDLSGLSTTTYSKICLQTTLAYSSGTPYLNDWTLTWGSSGVVSVTLEPGSGTVTYGTVATSEDTTSSGVDQTQTVKNNGNVAEDFDIKGQDSADWTLGASAGNATYKHEWCTSSCDSTPTWHALTTTYDSNYLVSNIAPDGTQDFDLQITVPTSNAGNNQQNVDVFIQATQH